MDLNLSSLDHGSSMPWCCCSFCSLCCAMSPAAPLATSPCHTTTQHMANVTATTPDSATAAGAAVSPLCQEALLLIAGVEPNPGPASTEDILAGLCATAPSVDIRDCLRMYNPNHSNKQHKTEFSKCSNPPLLLPWITCMSLARMSLRSLHASTPLFAESRTFYLMNVASVEKNTVSLWKRCICLLVKSVAKAHTTSVYGITSGVQASDQEEFRPNDALEKLNPTSLTALHYLSSACEATTIPDKEAGLLKGKSTSSPRNEDQVSQSQEHVAENSEDSTGVEDYWANPQAGKHSRLVFFQ